MSATGRPSAAWLVAGVIGISACGFGVGVAVASAHFTSMLQASWRREAELRGLLDTSIATTDTCASQLRSRTTALRKDAALLTRLAQRPRCMAMLDGECLEVRTASGKLEAAP